MWNLKGIKSEKISGEIYKIESLRGVELDNYLFALGQRTDLNAFQKETLRLADVAYLQDREQDAADLLSSLYRDMNGIELDSIPGSVPIQDMGIDPEDIIF